ncbi:hypothetical protein JTB14_004870 [Gonioctena quinquepunctata]|nr:hypothetical protein JTB14_004870 [Gonioctena quinquepunctata]
MRVNADHWNVLLDFAEKHPSIITHKFQGVHGRQNQTELWDELSNKLNSLGYGISPVSSSRDFCQTIGTPKLILVNPNKAQPYQQTPATFTKCDQAVHTSTTPECSLQDQGETAESTVEQRHSQKKLRKSGSTDTILSMHNDLVNILEKININLGSLASSGKEVVDILKN